ncbi:MAG: ATP-binding protein [Chloroflexi bacterium]|nr:ATP-binding protein [Chloroflexota bacterium]
MSERIEETPKGPGDDTSRASLQTSGTPNGPADLLGDPDCPNCGGVGYLRLQVPVGHPDYGRLEICDCREPEIRSHLQERLFRLSHLDELKRLTFDTFNPDGRVGTTEQEQESLHAAFRRAKTYSQNFKGWLLLQGGFGVGKTHLAASIANEAAARGVPTLFLTVPDLLDELRATFSDKDTTFQERFDEIRTAPLIVLDDFGTQNATEWAREKLFQILNHRYTNHLSAVITTNLALEEIEARLRSRILDSSLVDRVYIHAPDYRTPMKQSGREELSSLDLHHDQTFGTFSLRKGEKLPAEQIRSLEDAQKAAQVFAENPKGWLMLGGSYGVGKTHLAAAIANHRSSQGFPVIFVVVPDLLDHLRATFSPNSTISYDRRFEEIRNAPLLVLDDLGAQAATPWVREKLDQLFNHRYNAKLPTVITSAETPDKIDPRLRAWTDDRRLSVRKLINAPSYRGGS